MAAERDAWPWRAVAGGVVLRVRAQPGAKRAGVGGVRETQDGPALVVVVHEAPQKGRANRAVAAALAEALGVPRSAVVLRRGETQRLKVFHIAGDGAALARRLAALVQGSGGQGDGGRGRA